MLTAAQRLLLLQTQNEFVPVNGYNPNDMRRQYVPLGAQYIPALYNIQGKNYKQPRKPFSEREIMEIKLCIEKGKKWKLISKILKEEYDLQISQKVVRFKATEIERKRNDFQKFHSHYTNFPKEISVYINENDERYPLKIPTESPTEDNNQSQDVHVRISIERRQEEENFAYEISDVDFSADNSDWSAETDSDDTESD